MGDKGPSSTSTQQGRPWGQQLSQWREGLQSRFPNWTPPAGGQLPSGTWPPPGGIQDWLQTQFPNWTPPNLPTGAASWQANLPAWLQNIQSGQMPEGGTPPAWFNGDFLQQQAQRNRSGSIFPRTSILNPANVANYAPRPPVTTYPPPIDDPMGPIIDPMGPRKPPPQQPPPLLSQQQVQQRYWADNPYMAPGQSGQPPADWRDFYNARAKQRVK